LIYRQNIFKFKSIFLKFSDTVSSHIYITTSSLLLVVVEAIGFIVVGFVMLYLSFFQNDFVFYIFISIAVLCIAIGLHLVFTLVLYLVKRRSL
jgi:signal transduction histidine kinase